MDINYKERCENTLKKIICKNKPNIIFGAGLNGGILKEVLNCFGIDVKFFVVNDGHKKEKYFKGLLVYELSEIENLNDYNLLNSIQYNSSEICYELKRRTSNVLLLNDKQFFHDLFIVYYEKYFKHNNIDISEEIIKFGNIKFINPFLLGGEYLDAFLHEVGDLIGPTYNDYSNLCEGPYEYSKVNLCENDVIIDCGANIGLFSAVAASKKCISYAFEPMPTAIKYLRKTADLYKGLIKICEYALGNSCGDSEFYLGVVGESSLLKNTKVEQFKDTECTNVSMITIDEFVKSNKLKAVDFIKADIEGAERYMLEGAKETLAKFSPKISICTYHLEDDPQVLENLIKKFNPNYIIEHKWKKLYAYVPK